ncbi:MAG: hypothetical protein R3B51_03350 [Thermodesulfobacteriota bacterium]
MKMKIRSTTNIALQSCAEAERALGEDMKKIAEDVEKLGDFEKKLESLEVEMLQNSAQFTERIRSRLSNSKREA